jgi:hypothetical protein
METPNIDRAHIVGHSMQDEYYCHCYHHYYCLVLPLSLSLAIWYLQN